MTPKSEAPKRIQRRRTKGWRMPEGAIYVGRPTMWGNPYRWQDYVGYCPEYEDAPWELRRMAASDFEGLTTGRWARLGLDDLPDYPTDQIASLAGHDLACWCPLDQPCHADVLLTIANSSAGEDRP